MLPRCAVAFVAVGLILGCGGATDSEAGSPEKAPDCPVGLPGPVLVGATSADRPFCIDATEVTNADYGAFLDAVPGGVSQGTECSWNSTLLPEYFWPYPENMESHPVASVDWCDATAYCKWAGKRLCASIHGTALHWKLWKGTQPDFDPGESEWYQACSAHGTQPYFYGTEWEANACKAGTEPKTTVAVGSLSTCRSYDPMFTGLYDMIGNVAEWEDACAGNEGAFDSCLARGSSYDYFGPADCQTPVTQSRSETSPTIGFRCCADPI